MLFWQNGRSTFGFLALFQHHGSLPPHDSRPLFQELRKLEMVTDEALCNMMDEADFLHGKKGSNVDVRDTLQYWIPVSVCLVVMRP